MNGDELYALGPDERLPSGVLARINDQLEMFSAALAAVSSDPREHPVRFVGSGTLVQAGRGSYILTAAHVWTEALEKADRVAIQLGRDDTGLTFPKDLIEPTILGSPPFDDRIWGPDLAFLSIPTDVRNQLQDRGAKAFYNLDLHRAEILAAAMSPRPGMWVVVGCPARASRVVQGEALDMRGASLFGHRTIPHANERYDFLDVVVDPPPRESIPESLQGVSGGGLWWTPLTKHGTSGEITWDGTRRLEGVAFREEFDGGRRVRCHWRRSLYKIGLQALGSASTADD